MDEGTTDPELLRRAKAYVRQHNGIIQATAQALGVQYDFFYRFLKSGTGRSRNIADLKAGLDRVSPIPPVQGSANVRKIVQTGETRSLTRAILQELIGALDAVEARAQTQERSDEHARG